MEYPLYVILLMYVVCMIPGEVTVGFEMAGLTVGESDDDLLVPVTVRQQIAQTVSVMVEVVSGTATAGEGE